MKIFKRLILALVGLTLMAIGINMYLLANLGLGSWDILHNNLKTYFGLTFGTWVGIVGLITILISLIFKFQLKSFFSVLTSYILGLIIDFFAFNVFVYDFTNIYIRIVSLIFGLIFLGSGISLLVLTKLPPTPPDILMLSITHRFKVNFTISKTITEFMAFVSAITIGYIGGEIFGNVGIGTIITLLLIGYIIDYTRLRWIKLFRLSED